MLSLHLVVRRLPDAKNPIAPIDRGVCGFHTRSPMRRWILPSLVALFIMAGSLKGIPALTSLPVDLTLGLAVVLWWLVIAKISRTRRVPRAVLPVLGVFVLLAVPLLWTTFTPYALEKTGKLFFLTTLAVIAPIVLFRTETDLQRLIIAWAGACALVVATAAFYPIPESVYGGASLQTVSTNTIGLGRAGGVVLVVCALILLYRRGWRRPVAFVALAAAAVAMLDAGSRGPLLAAIVALMAAVFFSPGRRRIVVAVGVLLIVGGSLLYAYRSAPQSSQTRIVALVYGDTQDSTTQERLDLFSIATEQIGEQPLGLGWGGFAQVVPDPYLYPHDLALEILVEAGWIPGLMLIGWIGLTWWRARRDAVDVVSTAAFALLSFTLVNSLVSGDINDNRILFLAIGICIAVHRTGLDRRPLRDAAEHGAPLSGQSDRRRRRGEREGARELQHPLHLPDGDRVGRA